LSSDNGCDSWAICPPVLRKLRGKSKAPLSGGSPHARREEDRWLLALSRATRGISRGSRIFGDIDDTHDAASCVCVTGKERAKEGKGRFHGCGKLDDISRVACVLHLTKRNEIDIAQCLCVFSRGSFSPTPRSGLYIPMHIISPELRPGRFDPLRIYGRERRNNS